MTEDLEYSLAGILIILIIVFSYGLIWFGRPPC